ncbi:Rv1733c family protein [Rhodococcus chondri]|uniref:Transmembrane protein n=1 Tax=Rhodococcus chondri TaxID=3065941 RepID=A0ABU7JV84_9NOCA|nr:hypothetical protein [Rhodococcus sp. CC-R104]MEE2033834.1 hypothetical protein [Rhodococcus sp. CC-R104]
MMTTAPSWSVRWWRRAPWHRSPLLRRGDRIESTVALVVAAFVVMMVPIAATYGTITYGNLAAQAQLYQRIHRQVEATVLDTVPPEAAMATSQTDHPPAPATVPADRRWVRWSMDGHAHTAQLSRPADVRHGERIGIWIDSRGVPVEAPRSGTDSAATAVIGALALWAVVLAGGSGLWYAVHRASRHRRLQGWEREWDRADNASGWSAG